MKAALARLCRRVLRRGGVDLIHCSDDPIVAEILAVRETLRVSPDLPAWKRDYLLSQLAARAHLQELLRRLAINLVIDVGANQGQFALGLRALGYRGRIVSFEPQTAQYAHLRTLTARDAAWEIHPFALGDAPAELRLNAYRDHSLSSLHSANDAGHTRFPDYFQLDHVETVTVRRLDDFLDSLQPNAPATRILLKTDTQGHDLAVLHGGRVVLKHSVAVMTEASIKPIYDNSSVYEDLLRFMTDAGFSLSGIFPLAQSDRDMALLEIDCCFVRPSGFATSETPGRSPGSPDGNSPT